MALSFFIIQGNIKFSISGKPAAGEVEHTKESQIKELSRPESEEKKKREERRRKKFFSPFLENMVLVVVLYAPLHS